MDVNKQLDKEMDKNVVKSEMEFVTPVTPGGSVKFLPAV